VLMSFTKREGLQIMYNTVVEAAYLPTKLQRRKSTAVWAYTPLPLNSEQNQTNLHLCLVDTLCPREPPEMPSLQTLVEIKF